MNVNTCPVMPGKLTAEEVIDLSRHRAIALVGTVENPDRDAHEAYLVETHFYADRIPVDGRRHYARPHREFGDALSSRSDVDGEAGT